MQFRMIDFFCFFEKSVHPFFLPEVMNGIIG